MSSFLNRLGHLMSQILFSLITPPLLLPRVARLQVTRVIISFCFGRLYGNKYDRIIEAFEDKYAEPMSMAIEKAKEASQRKISFILDCGTGTGFVTRLAADAFPQSSILAIDVLPTMLELARKNCRTIESRVVHVRADTFSLPLRDESVDLVMVQNTIPCFHEFYRVLRPGGMALYVDTSAGWIARLAKRLVERHHLFKTVAGERAGMGFYVLAQKARIDGDAGVRVVNQDDVGSLMKCPLDKRDLTFNKELIKCDGGHCYPVIDGFPALIGKESRLD